MSKTHFHQPLRHRVAPGALGESKWLFHRSLLGVLFLLAGWFAGGPGSALGQSLTPEAPIGTQLVVTALRGLNLRAEPGLTTAISDKLVYGAAVRVVAGPVDRDGVTWLQVRSESGSQGWASTAYLSEVPLTAPVPTPTLGIITPGMEATGVTPLTMVAEPLAAEITACSLWTTTQTQEVYTQPNSASVNGHLPENAVVTILGLPQMDAGSRWIPIAYRDTEGWIPARALQPKGSTDRQCLNEQESAVVVTPGRIGLEGPTLPLGLVVLGLLGIVLVYRLSHVPDLASRSVNNLGLAGVVAVVVGAGWAAYSRWSFPLVEVVPLGFWEGWALVVYVVNSVVTALVYGFDKRAAQVGQYRIPETTLHVMEFLGGWPGAAVAQQAFRHKRRKGDFMALFVLIVLAHILFWGWYVFA